MEFPLAHGNTLGDEYEWEILLQKYLTHSTIHLTFNDNSSTLTVFKKTSKHDEEYDLQCSKHSSDSIILQGRGS